MPTTVNVWPERGLGMLVSFPCCAVTLGRSHWIFVRLFSSIARAAATRACRARGDAKLEQTMWVAPSNLGSEGRCLTEKVCRPFMGLQP